MIVGDIVVVHRRRRRPPRRQRHLRCQQHAQMITENGIEQ